MIETSNLTDERKKVQCGYESVESGPHGWVGAHNQSFNRPLSLVPVLYPIDSKMVGPTP